MFLARNVCLLVSFWLVVGGKGALVSKKDYLQGASTSFPSRDVGQMDDTTDLALSDNHWITSGSLKNAVVEGQLRKDVSLWRKTKQLRDSTTEVHIEQNGERKAWKSTIENTAFGGIEGNEVEFIRYTDEMSPRARMLESTLRGISQRIQSDANPNSSSLPERRIYNQLRNHVDDIFLTYGNLVLRNEKLKSPLELTDETRMTKADSKGKFPSEDSLPQLPASEIVKEMGRDHKLEASRGLKRLNESIVNVGLSRCLHQLKASQLAPHELQETYRTSLEVRTDLEKVIFGAIEYMYHFDIIDKSQMENFFSGQKGVMELFGNHLHNVYQLAEGSQFEPTVDFLADTNHVTWYIHDCLTDLRKGTQEIIIHEVLSKTFQSFLSYCSKKEIVVDKNFKRIATILNQRGLSINFKLKSRKPLKEKVERLFKHSLYYESEELKLEGIKFTKTKSKTALNPDFCMKISQRQHQHPSTESLRAGHILNFYILNYAIQYWGPLVSKKGMSICPEYSKLLDRIQAKKQEISIHRKTYVFFDSTQGLCKLI